jgi:hypothetical protein
MPPPYSSKDLLKHRAQLKTTVAELRLVAARLTDSIRQDLIFTAAKQIEQGTYTLDKAIRIDGASEWRIDPP